MYRNKNSISTSKTGKNLLVCGFVLFLMTAIAVGDVKQSPVEVVAGETVSEAEVDVSGAGTDVFVGERIKVFKCREEEGFGVRKALAMLGSICQKNIVPTPDVDGQLAFRQLSNVTFDEAMDAILGGKFEYEQKGNLVEVYPKGDKSRMKYEVFALHYISAAEASKLITPILSGDGTIGITSAAETGVPTGESISAQTGGGDTMSLRDTIVVYDYAENIKRAKELITAIDVRPRQVLVEATILSATLTEDTQFGIDWQTLKGTVANLTSISSGTRDFFKSDGIELGGATGISGGLTIGLALGDVGTFIRAVEQVTDVTILANPKILAVNKQLGQVYIGDKIGYESETTITEGAVSTSRVSFLDTGTKLSFRPYISADGYIRMDIHAKNSAESSKGKVISETSTELVSNVMVKDGGTIVIGGLFQDTAETKKSQVPILGDLPIVGGVFRGTADQHVRKEVIVLLTPHIITEPSQTKGDARAEDIRRKRFGAKDQLQWIGRARLAEDRYAKAAKYYLEGDYEAAMKELSIVLTLRPTYLEAIRLKEKIVGETELEPDTKIERKIIEAVEQEDLDKWLRL